MSSVFAASFSNSKTRGKTRWAEDSIPLFSPWFVIITSILRSYFLTSCQGRSPYEAPEGSALADSNRRQEAVRQVGAPVQMYDARGHPVNPDSRQRARAVRRANNDVLRTFGVVVSSQSTREETAKEQRDDLTVGNLSWENYVGLGMSTTDLLVMFVSMWWMVSLRANFEVRQILLCISIDADILLDFQFSLLDHFVIS